MNKREIKHDARDQNLADDLDPAGFERITRTRPSKRPTNADRVREETRRPQREGKWK